MKKVKINCKYYLVQSVSRGGNEIKLYNLLEWIDEINKKSYEERKKGIKDVVGRVESLKHRDKSKIYALNFMRLDEYSSSFKVKDDRPAEHINIEIDNGEYIGKNTVCLYDSEHGIIMLQTNRGGYTEKAVERYINSFFEDNVCELTPIIKEIDILNTGEAYRKLDIRLANINSFQATKDSWFEAVIEGMNEVEGINVHLEVSCGNAKNHTLHLSRVRTLLRDIFQNRECVSSANVTLADEKIEGIYSLFDNICNDTIEYEIGDNGGISFERIFDGMYKRYITFGARETVINALCGENKE